MIYNCLLALQHCHAMGITHRDIKPDNLMFGSDGEIRLVDFGLAKDTVAHMHTYAGTPYFMAPEVIDGDYTHKCDIWSLACVLYMMTALKLPFDGNSKSEVFAKIRTGVYDPPRKPFSPELESLLFQMFSVDPDDRPTAVECLSHIWFKNTLKLEDNIDLGDAITDEHVLTNIA